MTCHKPQRARDSRLVDFSYSAKRARPKTRDLREGFADAAGGAETRHVFRLKQPDLCIRTVLIMRTCEFLAILAAAEDILVHSAGLHILTERRQAAPVSISPYITNSLVRTRHRRSGSSFGLSNQVINDMSCARSTAYFAVKALRSPLWMLSTGNPGGQQAKQSSQASQQIW